MGNSNQEKNIFLIGFMGSGKSTIGRMLAKEMRKVLVEMDETIEAEAGKSINQIFSDHGEEYFRDLETGLIERITVQGGAVVSCGGGAILREENVEMMKQNGIVFYLCATSETIYERVHKSTHRPLLNGNMNVEYIQQLMDKRVKKYEAAADEILSVDGKEKKEIVHEIKKIFQYY